MANVLVYIPNIDTQNQITKCRLQLVVETFGHSTKYKILHQIILLKLLKLLILSTKNKKAWTSLQEGDVKTTFPGREVSLGCLLHWYPTFYYLLAFQLWGLLIILISWFFMQSVPSFQPLIVRGNFVCHYINFLSAFVLSLQIQAAFPTFSPLTDHPPPWKPLLSHRSN